MEGKPVEQETLVHTQKSLNKPLIVISLVTGFLIGFGNAAAATAEFPVGSVLMWAQCVIFSVLVYIFFSLTERLLSYCRHNDCQKWQKRMGRIDFSFSPVSLTIVASFIFLMWLPYLVILRPGVIEWDAGDQIAQGLGYSAFGQEPGQIYDHHPFLGAIIFAQFIKVSIAITGSYKLGAFVLVTLQCIGMAVAFSCLIAYIRENLKASFSIALSSTLFVALFPVFPFYFSTVLKDSFHALFLLPWAIMYVEMVRTRLNCVAKASFSVTFIIFSVLVCLTRKTGPALVFLALIMLVFVKTSVWKKLAAVVTAFVIFLSMSSFLPRYVYPALNVVPTDSEQYYIIPLQMTARWGKDHPGEATEKEKNIVSQFNIFTYDEMTKNYEPFLTDKASMYKLGDASLRNDYFKVWLSQGLKHPKSYIDAFAALESGWFAISKSPTGQPVYPYDTVGNQMTVFYKTVTNPDTTSEFINSPNDSMNDSMGRWFNYFKQIPVINITTYTAFWTWLLPMFAVYMMIRRNRVSLLLLQAVPFLLGIASLYASSTAYISRYMLFAMYLAPLLIGIISSDQE